MGWLDKLRPRRAADPSRWVMVDVESTGLDPRHDSLLAIAGVALEVDWQRRRLAVRPADSFEATLFHAGEVARSNILVHGIGVGRQRAGMPPEAALAAFDQFTAAAPLLGFHCAFDATMIDRAARLAGNAPVRRSWADLEPLCAVLCEEIPARSLDDWLAHFGIRCTARHNAAADALAQAELMLCIWPRLARQCNSWSDVMRLAEQARWLRRQNR
jgi:DNA polymerase-3 subunit epsilon